MLLEQQDAITLQARVSKQGGYFRVIPESNRILTLVNVPIRYINSAIAAKWLTAGYIYIGVHQNQRILAQ